MICSVASSHEVLALQIPLHSCSLRSSDKLEWSRKMLLLLLFLFLLLLLSIALIQWLHRRVVLNNNDVLAVGLDFSYYLLKPKTIFFSGSLRLIKTSLGQDPPRFSCQVHKMIHNSALTQILLKPNLHVGIVYACILNLFYIYFDIK